MTSTLLSLGTTRGQRGATLVMGLIFLVLLTILGLASIRVGSLEERMSGNSRDRNLAFQAAEASLRDCERVLQAATPPVFNNTNGNYLPAAVGSAPRWQTVDWTSVSAVRVNVTIPAGAALAPRCIIEELPIASLPGGSLKGGFPLSESGMFRITARGFGRNTNTVVMLQSTYVR